MKLKRKGVLTLVLIVCQLIGLFSVCLPVLAEPAAVTVYDLTVNDTVNPIGIDTETPTFGWKLQSNTVGQKQTGYRLEVATDKACTDTVWDSGKVESDDTTAIAYAGAALADCTRYYWRVTVWDMNGATYVSDIHYFETAFISGVPLEGAQWIEVGAPAVGTSAQTYTTNYVIELDVLSVTNAVSVIFGGKRNTAGSAAMWQIKDTGSAFTLAPHKWLASLSGTSVTIADGADYAAMKSAGFSLKLAINDAGVTTYVDGKAVSTVTTEQLGYIPVLGMVGLRQATNESCTIDNLVITDYASHSFGDVLESYDFSELPPTYSGDATPQIVDEHLVVYDADGWFGNCYFVENLATSSLRYTVDADILDIENSLGILLSPQSNSLSNMLLWQFVDNQNSYSVKPHYRGSGWTAIGTTKFATGEGEYAALENGFHVTMEVTDNRIKTYINGKLISDVSSSQINNIKPTLKYVVPCTLSSTEGGVLDNLKITDYSYLEEGQVIRFFDFEDPAPFAADGQYAVLSGSTVANGVYTCKGISGSFEWFNKVPLQRQTPVEVAKPVNVHYALEADVACESGAASLLFNMTDAKTGLMWQIITASDSVKIRPHKIVSGSFTAYSDIPITSVASPEEMAQGVKFRLEVADNVICTYVNGTLVSAFETAQLGMNVFLGKCGTRVMTDEKFTLDNLRLVDYIEDAAGKIIFQYDCSTFNPFFRGKLADGKLLMDSADWTGIALIHSGTDTFRKEFTATKKIQNARLYITSFGAFQAYLNGERVGNKNADGVTVYDELTPGWTDPNYRICYYTYDITDLLQQGSNTLSVGVTHGWSALSLNKSNDPDKPFKLLAKAVIAYEDGTTETVVTDGSWKTANVGPVVQGDIFQGEYYDATADISFRKNGFDDRTWRAAKTVAYTTTLTARDGGQIYVRKDLERVPQTVSVYDGVTDAIDGTQYGKIHVTATYGDEPFTLHAGETAVVDFGQNFAGWENITLAGAKGTMVRIRHAEMLNDGLGVISRRNDGPGGSIYTANLRNAAATTHYVMSGAETENYHPSTTYYGFRYIEITATADITVKAVRGEVVTSVTEDTGSFESSDALINRLYQNTVWGQYSNYFGQATDCPQRDERLGYSGDAQVFVGTAVYHTQAKAFLRNFIQTLVEGQADDGAYGNTLPAKNKSGSNWAGVAGWADAGILVPYAYYEQYGDTDILSTYYDSMAKYMDYLNSMELRIGLQFGDWLSYTTNNTQMKEYLSYVYTIWDAQMMQEIAAVLGKTEDVAKWETMEQKYLGIARPLFLDEKGDHVMTQQTALLFALKVGLYEDAAAAARGKEALVNAIRNNGNKLNTGFLGTSIIMETLMEIGEVNLAYELLFQEEDPSWLYSVKQGATTMWERWNSYSLEKGFGPADMNSFNHYAYGCIGEFLYSAVLGIGTEGEGFKSILLAPETTEKLTYAKGSYDSVNGLIQSAWELQSDGRYAYTFTVPMNTTATVRLKKQAYSGEFAVNGVASSAATLETDGVAYLKEEDGYVYYTVLSGTFVFSCEAIPALASQDTDTEQETYAFSVAGLSEYQNDGYTANNGKGWYTFPASETGIIDAITGKFHLYYNRESVYRPRTDLTEKALDPEDVYGGASTDSTRWVLLYNNYLQRSTNKSNGEIMRKIDSLVPLDSRGNEIVLTNFEAEFDARFESTTTGAVLLGFRQQIPGKFTNGWFKLEKEQAFVAIGRGGITIAGGNSIVSGSNVDGDMYNGWQTETFDTQLPQNVTVKVRAVGTTCQVWIYRLNTTEQLQYYNVEIPYEKAGTVAYGVSAVGHDIGNFKLVKLDDDGNPADILAKPAEGVGHLPYRHGDMTVTATEKTANGYRYTLTVQAEAGYELQAGGLYVKTADGKAYLPLREGFRKTGDATRYIVETSGGGTVYAQFVKPSAASPNVGNVGISINSSLSGVRFVSRFTRVAEDDKEYVVLDGTRYELKDYGMLLGLESVIGEGDLTLETVAENRYLKQISVQDSGIYYDLCDEYIDMSTCITGVNKVAGGADMKITARAYMTVQMNGVETVLYGAPFTASYNDYF